MMTTVIVILHLLVFVWLIDTYRPEKSQPTSDTTAIMTSHTIGLLLTIITVSLTHINGTYQSEAGIGDAIVAFVLVFIVVCAAELIGRLTKYESTVFFPQLMIIVLIFHGWLPEIATTIFWCTLIGVYFVYVLSLIQQTPIPTLIDILPVFMTINVTLVLWVIHNFIPNLPTIP